MKRHPLMSACLVTVLLVAFFLGLTLLTLPWLRQGEFWTGGEKVGVVEIKGLIADSRTTLKQLDRFKQDRSIKAVVLRVNSPGGAVGPSQEIMREVDKLRKIKKVVASLGTVAASGGYYVASGADLIIANPGTTTGSIGVIMQFANAEQLAKKLGLDFFTLKAGRYKDVGTPFRPMTPEDRTYLQSLLDNVYQQFLRDVAKNRKIPLEKMKELAEGRVYTGEEAKKVGLVDEFGNLQDAIERAGRLAGIKGKVEAVYPEKEGFSFLRLLLGQDAEESLANLSLPYPEPAFLPPWFK
ncbi:MAG: signal peptide peptidase SppA [Deltaproteobacteria bacterium]|nr:signal peptide peptidase SppA [Deltaproteobacteria bacterium]MBI4796432.1 signal peptide peptidase SppA [Deltaproteobacteria bacterium]